MTGAISVNGGIISSALTKNMKSKLLILLAAVFAVIAIFSVAIYSFEVDNRMTRAFNKAVPILPAATVNGRFITFSALEMRLEMYRTAVWPNAKAGADN